MAWPSEAVVAPAMKHTTHGTACLLAPLNGGGGGKWGWDDLGKVTALNRCRHRMQRHHGFFWLVYGVRRGVGLKNAGFLGRDLLQGVPKDLGLRWGVSVRVRVRKVSFERAIGGVTS